MSSSMPALPKIGTLIGALEEHITLPPGNRGPSPLVVLSQLNEGREAELIADGLCARLRAGGRARVPYAQVAGAPSGPRSERVGEVFQKLEEELKRNRPGGFGRLRLPQFTLMCSVVETQLAERQASVRAKELRDQCFAERRKDSNLLKALAVISGGDQSPTGVPSLVWYWTRQPLFNVLPRWLYGRLQERRMTRKGSWYRQWSTLPKGTGFFQDAARFADEAPAPGTENIVRGGLLDPSDGEPETEDEREKRLERTTDVLLRAMLSDLDAAFHRRRISPWGRRRQSRFVIVLPQTDAYRDWTPRLIGKFTVAVEQTGSTGVVLVAAERSEGERTENLSEAAVTLKSWLGSPGSGGARVVRVGVESVQSPDPDAIRWLGRYPEISVPICSDVAPVAEAAVATAVTLGLLAGGGAYGVQWALDRSTSECIGAAVRPASSFPESNRKPGGSEPREVYDAAAASIGRQNKAADRAEKRGAVVRTVVYLGVPVKVGSWEDALYSGAIPEVRGIALAQEELNEETSRDQGNKVWLRVRIEDAGARFSKAPAVAKALAKEAGEAKSDLVGVVGLGQSRKATMEARDILGGAGLPMIGTVATAQEMQGHPMYRQVAPDNGREARIAADFARRGNIVRTAPDTCAPAEKAVVIANPNDTYSNNLSVRFTEAFGTTHTLWYDPDGKDTGRPARSENAEWVGTPREMAEQVCRHLKDDPRTVVYWASRSNEFNAFLDDFDGGTACNGRVSVLGGNDLTNSVVDKQKPSENHPGTRLYYAAHALPDSYPPHTRARTFRHDYLARYGRDQWSNDGRTPLAWDAMRVLSYAVNTARHDVAPAGFDASTVQLALVNGPGGEAGVRGATGSLVFGNHGQVPRDKRLLILHDTKRGAEVALECGIRDNGDEQERWGSKKEFACPKDQDEGEDGEQD